MEYWSLVFIPIVAVLGVAVAYLFKIGLKEKTYDENAAEQKKKYGTKGKPKYPQQKKPVKSSTKEKSVEKKTKVTFQSPIAKDTKKIEPPSNIPSYVDKTDGNVNAKKKIEKVLPKNVTVTVPVIGEKTQTIPNPGGKNINIETVTSKVTTVNPQEEPIIAIDATKKSNEKLDNSPTSTSNKNDNNNNIPASKTNSVSESTDNEDTDGSYNNDRISSVSYYNSNSSNGEKLFSKNKSVVNVASSENKSDNESTQKQKSNLIDATGVAKAPSQKKSKQEDDLKNTFKVPSKVDEKQIKDKTKKIEEKAKLSKELPKDDKIKEKVPPSPSKSKKVDDKVKPEQAVVGLVSVVYSASNAVEEKEIKPKNDKKTEHEKSNGNVEQNGDKKNIEHDKDNIGSNTSVKLDKTQSHKKNNTLSPGGKTSPIQNGKNHNPNVAKITKKQATEIKNLQKISNENDGPVNVNLLIPLIAKAELSRSEIQNLIDLLLNKQQEDPIIDAEWIEGSRQDPMVKLKKQLAEKEKLLLAEQEAHQAIQNKLKELRSELNVEKHNNKQFEESLNSRQAEFQALNTKLQAALEEKQNFAKQIQQLQNKLSEERMIMHSLKDEHAKTKSSLQQELLSQRQQLEMHITHLNEQHQQAIVSLESQLAQMAAQLQEHEATHAQMNDEIRECDILREQLTVQENQLAHYRQTATATQELVIQLEESQVFRGELERRLANAQYELKSVSEKYNCTVQNMKIENQELNKENARINEQIKNAFNERNQLQNENEKLNDQLQQLKEQSRKLQEIDQLENELNKYKSFVNEKTTEITELKNQINELNVSLQQSISRNADLEKQNKIVEEIEDNFKKQMRKNDELRCKNWKAMEALSTMEKSFENKVKEIRNLSHEIKVKEREEFIQRFKGYLPASVELNSSFSDDEWFDNVEKLFKEIQSRQQPAEQRQQNSSPTIEKIVPEGGKVNMLYELEKQNSKLQSMVSHYKGIISDTEGMLNSLQKHVEHEENRWSEQVRVLESKLDAVLKERDTLLSKAKMQNGCRDEDEVNEHKLNCDSKHSSILSADYS